MRDACERGRARRHGAAGAGVRELRSVRELRAPRASVQGTGGGVRETWIVERGLCGAGLQTCAGRPRPAPAGSTTWRSRPAWTPAAGLESCPTSRASGKGRNGATSKDRLDLVRLHPGHGGLRPADGVQRLFGRGADAVRFTRVTTLSGRWLGPPLGMVVMMLLKTQRLPPAELARVGLRVHRGGARAAGAGLLRRPGRTAGCASGRSGYSRRSWPSPR